MSYVCICISKACSQLRPDTSSQKRPIEVDLHDVTGILDREYSDDMSERSNVESTLDERLEFDRDWYEY